MITIYFRPCCPYCQAATSLLQDKKCQFTPIDITDNESLRNEMIKKAGGASTVPQIFIGDRHIGGYDDLAKLDEEGGLDKMLKAYQPGE